MSSDNWAVGDLALCVNNAPHALTFPGIENRLRQGCVYQVEALGRSPRGRTSLFMKGVFYPRGRGNALFRFRKIKPDQHEACEEEFTALLKRSKRKVTA